MSKKRWMYLIVAVVCVASLLVGGCAKPAPAGSVPVKILTPGVGFSAYIYGAAIMAVVNEHSDKVMIGVVPTKGTAQAFQYVREGKGDICRVSSLDLVDVAAGVGVDKPWENGRMLWWAGDSGCIVVVRADSPYYTVADLKGCKLAVAQKGSVSLIGANLILKAAGLDMMTDCDVRMLTSGEQRTAFKERVVDCFIQGAALGSPHIVELAEAVDIRIIGGEDFATKVERETDSRLPKTIIPKGTYKGVDEVTVNAFSQTWSTTKDLPTDIAYEITKIFFANYDDAVATYASIEKQTTRETVNRAELPVCPLHPGAKKALEELGWRD